MRSSPLRGGAGEMPMSRFSTICRCCIRDGVPRRSLTVAVTVGTILNLINQGDALFGTQPVNLTKVLLTYLVPYCVATYGAVSYQIALGRPARSIPPWKGQRETAPTNPNRPA